MILPIVSQLNKAHRQGSICRALGISRSGLHYVHQHRDRPVCDVRTETLFKAVFAENQQTYGSRRMRHALIAHAFTPQALNQAWTSDITYIRTRSGWLYLAVVMDLCSR